MEVSYWLWHVSMVGTACTGTQVGKLGLYELPHPDLESPPPFSAARDISVTLLQKRPNTEQLKRSYLAHFG